jgi:hypothetical protein
MLCCKHHSVEVLKLLLSEAGQRTGWNKTALMFSAEFKFSEGVQ